MTNTNTKWLADDKTVSEDIREMSGIARKLLAGCTAELTAEQAKREADVRRDQRMFGKSKKASKR